MGSLIWANGVLGYSASQASFVGICRSSKVSLSIPGCPAVWFYRGFEGIAASLIHMRVTHVAAAGLRALILYRETGSGAPDLLPVSDGVS